MARAVYYCSVSAASHSRRAGPAAAIFAAIAAWLCAGSAAGENLGDLYSVTVPYTGQSDAAFREAMRDVLVRATSGLMRRTSSSPASISTPASR